MKNKPPLGMESIKEATRYLRPAIALVWRADRVVFVVLFLITLVSSLIPVGQALMARWIVDSVLAAANGGLSTLDGLSRVGPFLAGEFGLILAGMALSQYRKYATEILNQKLSQSVAMQIMTRASELDIRYFEDAAFLDKLQSARQETKFRAMGLMNAGFYLLQNILTLVSFVAPILVFNPWIALVLFGSTLPAFVAQTYYSKISFRLHSWRLPEGRKMNYYEHLLTSDSSAKEIRIFQLAKPLLERHANLFSRIFKEDQKFAVRKSVASVFWGAVSSLSFYGCYAWIVIKTVAKSISLGQMTFYLTSFRQMQGTFSGLFDNINSIYENGLFMQNLFAVLEAPTRTKTAVASNDFHYDVSLGIEFQGVSFRYPGQSAWALKDFSLKIEPGQTIALVGENGSGKTTLIKLLTRLYEPTEGKILLFGQELSRFPEATLYSLFSAIFQDFVHYQSSARDNVGFGAVDSMHDLARIERAAHQGGTDELVKSWPETWDTVLGGWFQGARQLSGGQWQRIALSRAFMGGAEILILDEPTSSLDAENELAIFSRLKEMAKGKISFLVSHRFSTVRAADQIIVLKQGVILESGSHESLMRAHAHYAKLFELQAEGYR
jgi:ATP-binding cassette subfamily B protein